MKKFLKITNSNTVSFCYQKFSYIDNNLFSAPHNCMLVFSVAHEYGYDCSFTKFVFIHDFRWSECREPFYVIYSNCNPQDECCL